MLSQAVTMDRKFHTFFLFESILAWINEVYFYFSFHAHAQVLDRQACYFWKMLHMPCCKNKIIVCPCPQGLDLLQIK
jgi:hypothetical protein